MSNFLHGNDRSVSDSVYANDRNVEFLRGAKDCTTYVHKKIQFSFFDELKIQFPSFGESDNLKVILKSTYIYDTN